MLRDVAFTSTAAQPWLPSPYVIIHAFERSPGYILERHIHEEIWHMNYVMDGAVKVDTGEEQFTVYKNQMFIVPAGLSHKLVSDLGYKQIGVNIVCKEDNRGIAQLVQTYFGQNLTVIGVNSPFESFAQTIELLKVPLPLNIARISNLMEQVILDAIEQKAKEAQRFSVQLSKIISENNPYSLTLKDVCRLTNYSKTHVERLAKKELHCGITEYLNNMKLDHICVLLQETDLSVTEIAEQTGLYDASHLITFFKKHIGTTPGAYRRSFRKNTSR